MRFFRRRHCVSLNLGPWAGRSPVLPLVGIRADRSGEVWGVVSLPAPFADLGDEYMREMPGSPTIMLPCNRSVLSLGVVRHALGEIGGYPISRFRDLLDGELKADA